jgi:hypothetical protein
MPADSHSSCNSTKEHSGFEKTPAEPNNNSSYWRRVVWWNTNYAELDGGVRLMMHIFIGAVAVGAALSKCLSSVRIPRDNAAKEGSFVVVVLYYSLSSRYHIVSLGKREWKMRGLGLWDSVTLDTQSCVRRVFETKPPPKAPSFPTTRRNLWV